MDKRIKQLVIGYLNGRRNRAKAVRGIAGAFGGLTQKQYEEHTANGQVPAVYVGTYGKYNNGSLFGQWIDVTSFYDYDEFMEYLHLLHADEEDPEFMVQDFENFPKQWYDEGCVYDKNWFDQVNEYANSSEQEAIDAYISIFGEYDQRKFEDRYEGEHDSMLDFAYYLVDSFGLENMDYERYFDYNQFARDLEFDYHFEDGYVFRAY